MCVYIYIYIYVYFKILPPHSILDVGASRNVLQVWMPSYLVCSQWVDVGSMQARNDVHIFIPVFKKKLLVDLQKHCLGH